MTNQQIFDHVARALLRQGKQAMAPVASGVGAGTLRCVYLEPSSGLRCAIGHLLTDLPDKFVEELDGGVEEIGYIEDVHAVLYDGCNTVSDAGAREALLTALQEIHDNWQPSGWPRQLRLLAEQHELSATVVEEFSEKPH